MRLSSGRRALRFIPLNEVDARRPNFLRDEGAAYLSHLSIIMRAGAYSAWLHQMESPDDTQGSQGSIILCSLLTSSSPFTRLPMEPRLCIP
jgi:hypothetical protein